MWSSFLFLSVASGVDDREARFSPEEVSRELQILAADNSNLLTAQDLLSDDGGQTAKQMTTAINDDSLKRDRKNIRLRLEKVVENLKLIKRRFMQISIARPEDHRHVVDFMMWSSGEIV